MMETVETQSTLKRPTYEEVEHWLRRVEYTDRLTGYKMTPSAGNMAHAMYSLPEALRYAFGNDWNAPYLNEDFKGGLNWIDVDKFIAWIGDTIGDTELAHAMREPAASSDSLFGRIKAVEQVVTIRMEQYREVRDEAVGSSDEVPPESADPPAGD